MKNFNLTNSVFSTRIFKSSVFQLILLFLAGTVISLLVITSIPWNMDEFIMYRRLACKNELQNLIYEIGIQACNSNPLSIFGIDLQRSFQYVGSASSTVFLIFWELSHNLWATYIYGLLSLIVIYIGIKKSFGLSARAASLIFVFFPILMAVLHDAGPTRISLMVIAWSPYLFLKYKDARNKYLSFVYILLISLLWTIATEDKPFFVFMIPGTIFLAIAAYFNYKNGQNSIRRIFTPKNFLFFLIPLFTATCFLLLAKVENGQSYLIYLASQAKGSTTSHGDLATSINSGINFLKDWSIWPHRVLDVAIHDPLIFLLSGLVGLFWLTILAISFAFLLTSRKKTSATAISLLLSSATFLFTGGLTGAWTTHHYVFLFIPLLIAIMISFDSNMIIAIVSAIGLVSCSISILFVISTFPQRVEASETIQSVTDQAVEVSRSLKEVIFVYHDWGGFFQNALLYSDEGQWLFSWPEDLSFDNELEKVASTSDRDIILIARNDHFDLEQLSNLYDSSNVSKLNLKNDELWSAYLIQPLLR